MLCPECKHAVPGGEICPQCSNPVPEQERFGGQGDRYLNLLATASLMLLIGSALVASQGFYRLERMLALWRSGNLWLVLLICLAPTVVGIYYWALLREEEITVTDEGITRRSHWGDETIAWRDVSAFRCQAVRFGETRLGQIARLGRLFRDNIMLFDSVPISYEIVGTDPKTGREVSMMLEPGTIDDMPWLMELIAHQAGPATMC